MTYHRLTNHEAGGYKASLSNPKTSDEAKERAHEMLDAERPARVKTEDHTKHVLAGYKTIICNDNVFSEAKERARGIL